MLPLDDHPHRRYNPLLQEWVLVSPHRTKRPWQGQVETPDTTVRPSYDPTCYLCPGNKRAGTEKNPEYAQTFHFANDFSAVLPDTPDFRSEDDLFQVESIKGECRVICFSPRHDLTLAEMDPTDIEAVISTWKDLTIELGAKYPWVQVFENKGGMMGCSNPHPHGQVWATDSVPTLARKEDEAQIEYFDRKGSPLLLDYALAESKAGTRTVAENDDWILVVPFWATWPYETLLLPKFKIARMPSLTEGQVTTLATVMKDGLVRYDNLFQTSFPYSMGWHGAPFQPNAHKDAWQLHAHFYPPLLRSATVRKFMVGYEMLGESQRDITAEQAAAKLRDQSVHHYRLTSG